MVNWKRPLTLIYRDNHKFGTALYEPTLDECERRYTSSLGSTSFRSDRPDLGAFGENSILGAALRRSTSSTRSPSRPKSLHEDLFEQRQSRGRSVALDDDIGFRCRAKASTRSRDDPKVAAERKSPRTQLLRQDSSAARDLRSEIEDLQARIAESERNVRQDSSALRDIMSGRLIELAAMLRDAELHNAESQKIIKKQAQLMADLESYCRELERRLTQTIDELAVVNNKCKTLNRQLNSD